MGINSRVFDLIATHCRGAPTAFSRALIAGYPDMLLDAEVMQKHLPLNVAIGRDKAEVEIQKRHGWIGPVVDPHEVFRYLSYDLTIIDIVAEHGEERIIDLNQRQADLGTYDLVVDHGTIEHCFNIGQAALTLIGAGALNGWMVQHLPFSMANHGFYNINPTWFFDLYEANGFEIVHFEMVTNEDPPLWSMALPHPHARFRGPAEALCTMVARRVKAMPPTIPQQHIYRR